jgi:hypothetical protein
MYRCKYFQIQELVPPKVYELAPNDATLWMIFDQESLKVLDLLRETYGPAVVNNWVWGGSWTLSGFRPWDSETGSTFSMHKFAKAFDVHFKRADIQKVRQDILNRRFVWMSKIHGLELEVSWLHFDRRNYDGLMTFKPS